MLKRVFILFLFVFAITPVLMSQTIPKSIVSAFDKGDAKKLSRNMHHNLEISLEGNMQMVSKNQATRVLQEFFDNNPPKAFKVNNEGTKAGSQYGIGTLTTKESSFRVNLYFIQVDEEQLIYNITIEKLEENAE
jgi:hypothetical protein